MDDDDDFDLSLDDSGEDDLLDFGEPDVEEGAAAAGAATSAQTRAPKPTRAKRKILMLIWTGGHRTLDPSIPKLTIGKKSANDICIKESKVSKYHCYVENGKYIVDSNSKNGTRVNGIRIERQEIKDGDSIEVGTASFHVASMDAPEETVSPSASPMVGAAATPSTPAAAESAAVEEPAQAAEDAKADEENPLDALDALNMDLDLGDLDLGDIDNLGVEDVESNGKEGGEDEPENGDGGLGSASGEGSAAAEAGGIQGAEVDVSEPAASDLGTGVTASTTDGKAPSTERDTQPAVEEESAVPVAAVAANLAASDLSAVKASPSSGVSAGSFNENLNALLGMNTSALLEKLDGDMLLEGVGEDVASQDTKEGRATDVKDSQADAEVDAAVEAIADANADAKANAGAVADTKTDTKLDASADIEGDIGASTVVDATTPTKDGEDSKDDGGEGFGDQVLSGGADVPDEKTNPAVRADAEGRADEAGPADVAVAGEKPSAIDTQTQMIKAGDGVESAKGKGCEPDVQVRGEAAQPDDGEGAQPSRAKEDGEQNTDVAQALTGDNRDDRDLSAEADESGALEDAKEGREENNVVDDDASNVGAQDSLGLDALAQQLGARDKGVADPGPGDAGVQGGDSAGPGNDVGVAGSLEEDPEEEDSVDEEDAGASPFAAQEEPVASAARAQRKPIRIPTAGHAARSPQSPRSPVVSPTPERPRPTRVRKPLPRRTPRPTPVLTEDPVARRQRKPRLPAAAIVRTPARLRQLASPKRPATSTPRIRFTPQPMNRFDAEQSSPPALTGAQRLARAERQAKIRDRIEVEALKIQLDEVQRRNRAVEARIAFARRGKEDQRKRRELRLLREQASQLSRRKREQNEEIQAALANLRRAPAAAANRAEGPAKNDLESEIVSKRQELARVEAAYRELDARFRAYVTRVGGVLKRAKRANRDALKEKNEAKALLQERLRKNRRMQVRITSMLQKRTRTHDLQSEAVALGKIVEELRGQVGETHEANIALSSQLKQAGLDLSRLERRRKDLEARSRSAERRLAQHNQRNERERIALQRVQKLHEMTEKRNSQPAAGPRDLAVDKGIEGDVGREEGAVLSPASELNSEDSGPSTGTQMTLFKLERANTLFRVNVQVSELMLENIEQQSRVCLEEAALTLKRVDGAVQAHIQRLARNRVAPLSM